MISPHGGNLYRLAKAAGRPPKEIVDFSASLNPLGPPEWLRPLISSEVSLLAHYPDPDCRELVAAAAEHYAVGEDEVIVGNGSSEIIHLIPRIASAKRAVVPVPAYSDYALAAELAGLSLEKLPMTEDRGFALDLSELEAHLAGEELVFLGHPNNPTGLPLDTDGLRELARRHPDTVIVVDEAFAGFVDGIESMSLDRPSNVVVVCSLTKLFAIPGLRLGLAIADAGLVRRARASMVPWSVNTLAQAVGKAALADSDYAAQTRAFVRSCRKRLMDDLGQIPGLTVYPGRANFVLAKLNQGDTCAPALADRLLGQGIAIRSCDNFDGLDRRFFRVAVRTEDENALLVHSLGSALGVRSRPRAKRRTPAVMLQGTGSNAGKSVLAAALCRILLQDGYSVAPFKAQNMSLNSCVTRDGGEMGRAQVVQAQAAWIEPDVRMNPILLKPNSDTGSQVILCGKPVGNMNFAEYVHSNSGLFEKAKECYESLASDHDVIVMEGAGSPAEVNLKGRDVVNMSMARHANAPVLLVGDIDRGGVYASFVGTMEVLAEWERELVAGFIVNRFRGIAELLGDAHDYVLRHTGRPVIGVVPYLQDLGLPEEDSVSFKERLLDETSPNGQCVTIAVVDLPHISNFTDFDSLRIESDLLLRIVRGPQELDGSDVVILPGSKNVIGDMDFLRRTGLDDEIVELARTGRSEVVGLCGGFQMLGAEIADPCGVESAGGAASALGLLPISTVLTPDKTLKRATGKHVASGLPVHGYEIHHGLTTGTGDAVVEREDGEVIGVGSKEGMVWGTYLHGIFDADEFRRWFIDRVRMRRGLTALGRVCATYDLEPAFDRLADVVRKSVDLDSIYRTMGL